MSKSQLARLSVQVPEIANLTAERDRLRAVNRELVEALENLGRKFLTGDERGESCPKWWKPARAALAKAKGE